MSKNIYLTGFMGSGKSAVGALLAKKLGRKFIDLDAELEKKFKCKISEYFARLGEESFREQEADMLRKFSKKSLKVIATGGGIVQIEKNRQVMERTGNVVYLKASIDNCAERIGKKGVTERPMWQDPSRVKELMFKRAPLYSEADIQIDTNGLKIAKVVDKIILAYTPDDSFSVRMNGVDCPVACSLDALDAVCSGLSGRKVALLTDKKVASLQLPRYILKMPGAVVIELPCGERIKTLKTAETVHQQLLDNHFNRDDMLVAIGGGTVTDLGAFVASTYKRGMNFMLISTTLLGCVDAAVGGKAAVNLKGAKNIIGTFTIPEMVVLDAGAFLTLPKKLIQDGLIEAYKTGLIENPRLAALIENYLSPLLAGDVVLLKEVASLSAQAKARVVTSDFQENGRRAILNFGHTYGHAIEGYYKYKISHGNAVALGMIVATIMSRKRKFITIQQEEKICKIILDIYPKLPAIPPFEEAELIMKHDKKIRNGKLVFALLEDIGEAVVVDDIKLSEIKNAIKEAEKRYL